jgi:hypothetical protein
MFFTCTGALSSFSGLSSQVQYACQYYNSDDHLSDPTCNEIMRIYNSTEYFVLTLYLQIIH